MNSLKILMISLFMLAYMHFYFAGFVFAIGNNFCDNCHIYYFITFVVLTNIIILYSQNKLYLSIYIKIFLFTLFLFLFFYIEPFIINTYLYSIGDSGGWLRHHIYNDIDYIFQWYEVLFWNFIFSLHYPLYIFIFFKPFVNHLDKSIKKIKEHEK